MVRWIFVVLLVTVPLRAQADVSKAWVAARDRLPAKAEFAVALDVEALGKSATWRAGLPLLMKEAWFATVFSAVKTGCKLDPFDVVTGLVVVGEITNQEKLAGFVQLRIDRARTLACLRGAASKLGTQMRVAADGSWFELDGETLHLVWVTPDVVLAVAERAELAKWSGRGAFAGSELAKQLAKVDTKAFVWGGFALTKPDTDSGVVNGSGTLALVGGKLDLTSRFAFATAKAAAAGYAQIWDAFFTDPPQRGTPKQWGRLGLSSAAIEFQIHYAESVLIKEILDAAKKKP